MVEINTRMGIPVKFAVRRPSARKTLIRIELITLHDNEMSEQGHLVNVGTK
jgi:hypothetical protein